MEYRQWVRFQGGPERFAVAWFTREWKPIEIGYSFNGSIEDFALPEQVKETTAFPLRFPRLIVRDPEATSCPYILGLRNRWLCLGPDLKRQKAFPLPFDARDYVAYRDGYLWVLGFYRGKILHGFDPKEGDLKRSVVDEGELMAFVRAHITASNLSKSTSSNGASHQIEVVILERSILVLLTRPPCLVRYTWPGLQPEKVFVIRGTDFPAFTQSDGKILPASFQRYGEQALVGFLLLKPVTYMEFQREDPELAEMIQSNWKKAYSGELMPDTVVGELPEWVLLELSPEQGIRAVFRLPRKEKAWRVSGRPFVNGNTKEVWVPVLAIEKAFRRSGVARLR